MQRRLLLFRHAKSSWAVPGQEDQDRDLEARGVEASIRIGQLLRSEGLIPDRVLCSTACRTRRTIDLVLGAAEAQDVPVLHLEHLYHAHAGAILGQVREHGAAAARLMVVGHNPGLEVLARRFTAGGPAEISERLADKMPTAGLLVLCGDLAAWTDVEIGRLQALAFHHPRDLE